MYHSKVWNQGTVQISIKSKKLQAPWPEEWFFWSKFHYFNPNNIYIYMFKIRCPINPYHLLKCPWGFKLSAWLCRNRKALNHDPWYPLGAETNIPLEGASQSVNEQPGILVGGIPTPLNNIKVSRDDSSQYMEKKKMFQTTNQIYIYIYSIPPVRPTGYT